MAGAPIFFLPGATPGNQEAQYADLAKRCHCDVPGLDARIYSIVFIRADVEWKATVGEILTGISRPRRGEPRMVDSDGTKVSAIFAGSPYQVWTNGFPTQWANPFLAEPRPDSVIYFAST
jgi:hypothetical protein